MTNLKAKLLYADRGGRPGMGQVNFLARRAGYLALAVFNNKFLDNVAFAYAVRARRKRNRDECGAGGNADYYFAQARKFAHTDDAKAIVINSEATYFFSRLEKNEVESAEKRVSELKNKVKDPDERFLRKLYLQIYWAIDDAIS